MRRALLLWLLVGALLTYAAYGQQQTLGPTSIVTETGSFTNYTTTAAPMATVGTWQTLFYPTKTFYFTGATNALNVQVLGSVDGTNYTITAVSSFVVAAGATVNVSVPGQYSGLRVQVQPAVAGSNGTLSTRYIGTTQGSDEFGALDLNDTVTILDTASLSDAEDLGGKVLCMVCVAANWTAANILPTVSADGVNYFAVYDKNGTKEVWGVTGTGGHCIRVAPSDFAGVRYLKLQSVLVADGTTPVAQAGGDVITLVSRSM